jgi:hypothetical protein
MEVSGQLHGPATLPLEKEPQVPLDRRLGGPQSQFGRCGEERNLLPLLGIEPRPSSLLPIATPTEISWLMRRRIMRKRRMKNNNLIVQFPYFYYSGNHDS